ncbi:MAG TPA: hypothetical protein VI895_06940 [Bdellovibrionota bacterium]|nr:hypothetical protein [Bdellovibrionota bacterium]
MTHPFGTNFLGACRTSVRTLRFGLGALGIPLSENENRLRRLKNLHLGSDIFVIGNGPSLKRHALEQLAGKITIACNNIFLMFPETTFRPTYYTVEDRLVAEDRAGDIRKLRGFTKLIPFDLRGFLPPDEDTIYINFLRRYPRFPKFSSRFDFWAFWGGTVTFLNLQLAYYLGARTVYLMGIDHTYAPPSSEDKVDGVVVHSKSQDRNHFHPDYFGPGYRWHDPKVERMELAYRAAKILFEKRGRTIINATAGGKLEVFPRMSLDDVLNRNG